MHLRLLFSYFTSLYFTLTKRASQASPFIGTCAPICCNYRTSSTPAIALCNLYITTKLQDLPIPLSFRHHLARFTTIMTSYNESTIYIDYPESPTKSESAGSEASQVSFKDDFETLPSSGPASHAHIIDIGEYAIRTKEDGALKLQDAIVTALFSVSPDTLKSFVSPTVNSFKAVFGKKDVQLVIWRKGLEVFVSHSFL
jgi:hypothetical protein